MKELLANISKSNKWLIASFGLLMFLLYTVFLFFRPQIAWCDETYFSDWARELALHGNYNTTTMEYGHPSHCPLYVFIMALWYKAVGFSFFAAHFPNMCFTLITYLLIAIFLTGRKYVNSWQGIAGFSALYWFAPSFFWIVNCGRIEIFCLLTGVLTAYSFIRAMETGLIRYKVELLVWSFLLFGAGIEGVVFGTWVIAVYSAFHYREAWKNKILYLWHFGGYLLSMVCIAIIAWHHHFLHKFFDKLFGFSSTFTELYLNIRALLKGVKHGVAVEDIPQVSQAKQPFFQSLLDGMLLNWEYLAILGVVLILFAILCYKSKIKNVKKSILVFVTLAIFTPFFFVLAGRYPLYYTWAAYIPCIMAAVMLVEELKVKWVHIGLGAIMIGWFFIAPTNYTLQTIDFSQEKDKQILEEIKMAQINPEEATCIPYGWYYYVVNESENLWFQACGIYPENLKTIIYDPNDYNEVERFMDGYLLHERCRIGDKIVYDVEGRK